MDILLLLYYSMSIMDIGQNLDVNGRNIVMLG